MSFHPLSALQPLVDRLQKMSPLLPVSCCFFVPKAIVFAPTPSRQLSLDSHQSFVLQVSFRSLFDGSLSSILAMRSAIPGHNHMQLEVTYLRSRCIDKKGVQNNKVILNTVQKTHYFVPAHLVESIQSFFPSNERSLRVSLFLPLKKHQVLCDIQYEQGALGFMTYLFNRIKSSSLMFSLVD